MYEFCEALIMPLSFSAFNVAPILGYIVPFDLLIVPTAPPVDKVKAGVNGCELL